MNTTINIEFSFLFWLFLSCYLARVADSCCW